MKYSNFPEIIICILTFVSCPFGKSSVCSSPNVIVFSTCLAKPTTVFKLMIPWFPSVMVIVLVFEQAVLLANQPTSMINIKLQLNPE